MISFKVDDMTCGHCISTLTKVLKWVDKGAKVEIDLATKLVTIEPVEGNAEEFAEAIKDAGYTPEQVAATSASTGAPAVQAPKGGSCCGTCH